MTSPVLPHLRSTPRTVAGTGKNSEDTTMSSFIRPLAIRPIAMSATGTRAIAVAALLGTTLLCASLAAPAAAAPLQLAQATAPQTPPIPPTPATPPTKQAVPEIQAAPKTQQGDTTAETKPETVDQRITSLHAALQITPQQEAKWDRVALVMRDNATAMQKLVAQREAQGENVTAVQDLNEYEKFTQAHLTGLRKLTSAFDTLYSAMPAAQKKVADQVFANVGHHHANAAAAHS
jgi:hypothetical protein